MRKLNKIFNRFFYCWQWNVGLVHKPIAGLLGCNEEPAVEWLAGLPAGRFWADPMVVRKGSRVYVFYEDYGFRTGQGVISVKTFESAGNGFRLMATDTDIIPANCHLSYPYLVEYKDRVYCIPETAHKREVAIYASEGFPRQWQKKQVLIPDYAGVDNTVFWYNDNWWLFSTDLNDRIESRLKIFYASDLFGPWKPHPQNPVKDDITSARPAGTPFIYQGELYRPAQDSSRVYGGRAVFNRVTELSRSAFQEESVKVFDPIKASQYSEALHTVSGTGDVTVIDGARQIFIGRSLSTVLYKLKRLLGLIRY